jgi:ADP-ribose pyrophosphatase
MEERVESEEVYHGRLFQVFKDRVRLDNGHLTNREIVRHPGSVAIIPRQADGRVVLVRQFRYVTGRELWEIPAGTLDKPGESIEDAARRELAEEAGLKAERWTMLGSAYLIPGYSDERMTFFLAEDLGPTEAHAELDESFKVNPFDIHDLQVLRSTGELQDGKSLLGLAWAGVPIWELPKQRV